LNPGLLDPALAADDSSRQKRIKRVIDRPDLQEYLPFGETA
jgi:hypothetical protein